MIRPDYDFYPYGFDADIDELYSRRTQVKEIIMNNDATDKRQDVEIKDNLDKIQKEIDRSTGIDDDTTKTLSDEIKERKENDKIILDKLAELEKLIKDLNLENMLTLDAIQGGDNVKTTITPDNKLKLDVELSENFKVDDIYSQDLPVKGDNLDVLTKKLSEAAKLLSDTTDGELF